MLFESISYRDSLPFSVEFINVTEENRHCHKEIEILMMLRGVAHYKIYHTDYELNPGDLIIADVEDLHQIHDSTEDVLMLQVHIDTSYFEKEYPDIRYMFFVCEECMEAPTGNVQLLQNKLAVLKHSLARLAVIYHTEKTAGGNANFKKKSLEGINDLVSVLVNHFQGFFMEDYQYKTTQSTMSDLDLQRLCRITRYILTNYNQYISLQDVSNMEHLSTYYVSHLIKKTLGFNFQNFVNAIRLEFAEKQLVFTNLPLMQISENCGFSSSNYFNKCFAAWHGKTPMQYRKAYHPGERKYGKEKVADSVALDIITPYLNLSNTGENTSPPYTVNINMAVEKKFSWQKDFAPTILIENIDQLIMAGQYENKLDEIPKLSIALTDNLKEYSSKISFFNEAIIAAENHTINCPQLLNYATILNQIFVSGCKYVPLCGDDCGVITKSGFFTPYYKIMKYYAEKSHHFLHVADNYVITKSKNKYSLCIFNINPHSVLEAHISLADFPQQFYLGKTEISEKNNCYSFPERDAVKIPKDVITQINDSQNATKEYTLVDTTSSKALDVMVYQNCTVLFEFYL